MSYLKLGWRWREPQGQRGWQAFPLFGLILHQIPSQFSPHLEPLSERATMTLTFQWLFKLRAFLGTLNLSVPQNRYSNDVEWAC